MNLAERLKARAIELGFDLVGIAPAGIAPHAQAYADWVTSGFAGEMAYMTRDPDRRSDLRRVLPDAKSVIVVGLSHYTIDLPDEINRDFIYRECIRNLGYSITKGQYCEQYGLVWNRPKLFAG